MRHTYCGQRVGVFALLVGMLVLAPAYGGAGCAPSLHGAVADGNGWGRLDPQERESSPATKALIRELDTAEGALRAELGFLALQKATKGQLMIGDRFTQTFVEMRQQIEAVLIQSAKIAPYRRRFHEALFSRHPDDPALSFERFEEAWTFAPTVLPIYDVRDSLDKSAAPSVHPFNMGVVYIGVAGKALNAVRPWYSASREALFDKVEVPKIYRFAARHAYVKDYNDFIATLRLNDWRLEFPSVAGGILPMGGQEASLPVRSMRLGVFSAARQNTPDPAGASDTVIFYWAILGDESDEVKADSQHSVPVFLGVDYVQSPDATGRCARAYDKGAPAKWLVRKDAPAWRVALCAPFEAVAKLAIGTKQTAVEVVKTPLNLLTATAYYGPGYLVSGIGNCARRVGATWEVLIKTWPLRWPQQSLLDIVAETPLIGKISAPSVSDAISGAPSEEATLASQESRRHVYLTRGTGGGGEYEQYTQNWQEAIATAYARPTALSTQPADVAAIPYRYASFLDTKWSILNLSDGPGYEMARDILFPGEDDEIPGARPGEAIYLAGHGAGVQRATDAARILSRAGAPVIKMIGFDGPSVGRVPGIAADNGRFPLLLPDAGARGCRSGERLGERITETLPRGLAAILSLPTRALFGDDLFVAGSANRQEWDIPSGEAGVTPGLIDPATGLLNWRAIGEDSQKIFLP